MSWNDLRKGRFSGVEQEYFITFVCKDRIKIFLNFDLAALFCTEILKNEQQCQCVWLTWVLMPDHFHGLLKLRGTINLSEVIKRLKGVSAREINRKRNINSPVWQANYYDRALRRDEDRVQISRYIVANPLRKGLVTNLKNYSFWNSVYL